MLFTNAKCGGAVDEFHEHAVDGAGVNEGDLAREAIAGLLINQLDVLGLEVGQRSVDVVYLQTDVMEAFAALLKEARDAGVRHDGLEQLQEAVANVEQSGFYALVFHHSLLYKAHAERVAKDRAGFFEALDDDSGVVNVVDVHAR